MDRLDAMRVFVAALDEGSLAGAGRRLGRSPAAVTRAVAFLEGHVGVQLMHRTTRALRLTVSDVPRPFDARRDQGGCWGGAQNHGINSSMRFCGQPFTRRVRRSVKYACGLT